MSFLRVFFQKLTGLPFQHDHQIGLSRPQLSHLREMERLLAEKIS